MQEDEIRESLTEADWAWLAGFLDGEGFFDIRRGYGKRRKHKRPQRNRPYKHDVPQDGWTWYSPRIVVAGTHLPSMERCATMLQGNVIERKPQVHSRLKLYAVEVAAREKLANILPNILPHLVVKKIEAELMFEFVGLPRGTDLVKQEMFDQMVTLSQARPGTTKV